jgi:hypothetical protein
VLGVDNMNTGVSGRESLNGAAEPGRDLLEIDEIEKMLRDFEARTDPAEKPLPPDRKRNRAGSKRRKKNGHPHPEFDLRTEAYKLLGVDVTQIPSLEENALPLFSEVGRDMSRWPSAGTLSPGLRCAQTTTSAAGNCSGEEREM